MKLVKTASGTQVKMSKSEWQDIGKTAGWDQDEISEVMCQSCHKKVADDNAKQYDGMQFCEDCYKVKEKESGPNPELGKG